MEERPAGSYQAQFGVIVVCESEMDQAAVYGKLLAQGFKVKVVTT